MIKEVLAKTVRLPVTASIIRLVTTSMVVVPEIYVHLVGRAGAAAWVGSILRLLAFYHVIKFYITYIRLKVLVSLYTVNKKAGTIDIVKYFISVYYRNLT